MIDSCDFDLVSGDGAPRDAVHGPDLDLILSGGAFTYDVSIHLLDNNYITTTGIG